MVEPNLGEDGIAGVATNFQARAAQQTKDDLAAVEDRFDLAVETGAYELTLQPKSGPVIQDKGKYLTVWKRQTDGSWRIVRDINNSDLPPKM